ncbi:MAG: AAA family ATPase [Comamonadaceae bacterium]|nr:AAA family ATPase [Comamonadaceae bacterium]
MDAARLQPVRAGRGRQRPHARCCNQMMRAWRPTRPVPPDLCYLHNFEAPERPRALRLPAGEGRLLRQLMARAGEDAADRDPAAAGWHRTSRPRASASSSASKAEEDSAYAELSGLCRGAQLRACMRDEGRMVFTQRDDKGEALTAGRGAGADAASSAPRSTPAEQALRAEISRFMEQDARRWSAR